MLYWHEQIVPRVNRSDTAIIQIIGYICIEE